jgi:SNF2 family DNA or RNA helicase
MNDSESEASSVRLQGLWSPPNFHVWGLRCTTDASAETSAIGLLGVDELRQVLSEQLSDVLVASVGNPGEINCRLPTSVGGILVTSAQSADVPPKLERTSVPTLSFSMPDVSDLLLGLQQGDLQSDSLRFWTVLARYGLGLLSREHFYPDMQVDSQQRYLAAWRLLVREPEELSWLERITSAMPPVARCIDGAATPELDPTQLVDSFLANLAEGHIRRCLTTDPFFTDIPRRASVEDRWELRWLAALLSEPRTITGDAESNDKVADGIQAWIAQVDEDEGMTPPKLALALVEPGQDVDPTEDWSLVLELHSPEDDSILDLRSILSEHSGAAPSILGQRIFGRRQHVVSQITQAAEAFPKLRRLLNGDGSTKLRLTTNEAHEFLRDAAPLLAAQGIDLELPEWATRLQQALGLQLFLRPASSSNADLSLGHFGLGTLVEFDWRVAIGEDQLSLKEFEALAAQNAPLVRLKGNWIHMEQQAAQQALAFMRRQTTGKMTLFEALRIAGGAEDSEAGLPIFSVRGSEWLDQLLAAKPDESVEQFDPPADFAGTLRPYQLRGLHWLAFLDRLGIGGCLADDMGLGKTIQLIALLLHERKDNKNPGPTLLFAPMSVVGNWEREIQRFAKSLKVLVHHGPLRLGGDAFCEAATKHDVVITTYGLASREYNDFSRVPWYRIAMDEAQKIKNPSANQTVALRQLTGARRIALTGTPVENHLSELWSIMEMLNPGLLGSAAAFRARFAVPIEKMGDQQRVDQLRRLIHPFILRRLKSDPNVLRDLPEKMEMRVFCNLTPEQAKLYEQTVAKLMDQVDVATGIRRRGLILATLTHLKQICNHPAHFQGDGSSLEGRSGKCERLVEMLEEVLEEGDAALIFTQYREMGDLLHKMLTQRLRIEFPFLHGGTSMKKRNEMIDKFQDPASSYRVFLLSLRAGGFGLNLTKANHVFHFDRWWNPAVEEQATDRAHRIGQTRRVQVHKFVCIGTVEERIDKLLGEKSALADRVVGSGDDWITGLSTVELREYLTLSPDAVSES